MLSVSSAGRSLSRLHLCLPYSRVYYRRFSTQVKQFGPNFTFYPSFFTVDEQCVLLRASLKKLGGMESGKFRRRRREFLRNSPSQPSVNRMQALFLPDEFYDFQEGHFDGVIKQYRETHVTSWPEDIPEVVPLLERLKTIHPPQETQTHIIHLASDGVILPHVDNVDASGTWILGVSLGDERMLCLESSRSPQERYELPLPSGSVYFQRDAIRYNYKHSILHLDGAQHRPCGQRLSIMLRDRLTSNAIPDGM